MKMTNLGAVSVVVLELFQNLGEEGERRVCEW